MNETRHLMHAAVYMIFEKDNLILLLRRKAQEPVA